MTASGTSRRRQRSCTRCTNRIAELIESQKPQNVAAARDLARGEMVNQEKALYQNMFDMVGYSNGVANAESQQVTRASHLMVWTLLESPPWEARSWAVCWR